MASSLSPSTLRRLKRYANAALKETKWWLPAFGSIASVVLLAKYLWTIGHPELLLEAIGSPTNLLAWLLFSMMGFAALLLVLAVPSVVLCFAMYAAGPATAQRPSLALFCGLTMLGCFALQAAGMLFLPASGGWAFALLGALCAVALALTCLYTWLNKHGREVFTTLTPGPQPAGQPTRRWCKGRLVVVAMLLGFGGLCGVFPAEVAMAAWRGGERGLEVELKLFGYFVVLMAMSLIPVIAYFLTPSTLLVRLRNGIAALGIGTLMILMIIPSILEVGVYAGANLLKVRDGQARYYMLAYSDYPRSLFTDRSWRLRELVDDKARYAIYAFKQFGFGDQALLCPGTFSKAPLRNVDRFSPLCVAVSRAKIQLVTQVRPSAKPEATVSGMDCLYHAPARAQIPAPMAGGRRCIIAVGTVNTAS